MFKNFGKNVNSQHLLCLLGLIVLATALVQYSSKKNMLLSGLASNQNAPSNNSNLSAAVASPLAANPQGENSGPANVNGIGTPEVTSSSCQSKSIADPSELLPNTANNWGNINPASGDLRGVNVLSAGHLAGINTVGSSLRNSNLQLRSEPPNPRHSVSPWMNTTIEPDLERKSLEIGCN